MQDQYAYDLVKTIETQFIGHMGLGRDSALKIAIRDFLSQAPTLPRELTDNELLLGPKGTKKCTA